MKKAIILFCVLTLTLSSCINPPSRSRARRDLKNLPRGPRTTAVVASDFKVPVLPAPLDLDRFENRKGADRSFAMATFGANPDVSLAIGRGLDWLKTNQSPTGSWESVHPEATTALALLAFLGNGVTEIDRDHGASVRHAVTFLEASQSLPGMFQNSVGAKEDPYTHALVLLALSEWAAMTKRSDFVPALDKAVGIILEGQQEAGGWSEGYRGSGARSTFLTGLQIQALQAAEEAGVQRPDLRQAVRRGIQDLVSVANLGSGAFGEKTIRGGSPGATAMALWCFYTSGLSGVEPCRRGLAYLDEALLLWPRSSRSMFDAFLALQVSFQHGGVLWRRANAMIHHQVLVHQGVSGDWPLPTGEAKEGPAYATALAVLMLQTPYRSQQSSPGIVPMTWTVRAGAGSATIMGILPVQSDDVYAMGSVVDRAIRASDYILIETDVAKVSARMIQIAQAAALSGQPLQVSEPVARKTVVAFRELGIPESRIRTYPAWSLAFMLYGLRMEDAGLMQEDVLTRTVRGMQPGLPVVELFLADTVATALSSISAAEQEALLGLMLEKDQAAAFLGSARQAWLASDEAGLEAAFQQLRTVLPRSTAAFSQQNRVIADQLAPELASGKHVFVLLNAFRLIGEDGVLKYLEQKAYSVGKISGGLGH